MKLTRVSKEGIILIFSQNISIEEKDLGRISVNILNYKEIGISSFFHHQHFFRIRILISNKLQQLQSGYYWFVFIDLFIYFIYRFLIISRNEGNFHSELEKYIFL